MIGDIFQSILFIAIGLVEWRALENYVDRIAPRRHGSYETKRVANWMSLTHSVITVALCAGMLVWSLDGWILVPWSVSYFIHDIRHYKPGAMIHWHHVFAIAAVIHGFQFENSDSQCYKWGYMLTEIGNLPVYVMYEFIVRPDKEYLTKYRNDLLLLEFVFYIVFRILGVILVMTRAVLTVTKFNALALQAANLIWVTTLYEQIITSMAH